MQVLHFSTFPYGGAAVAARRLHEELLKHGCDSRFIYSLNDRGPCLIPAAAQIDHAPSQTRRWPNFLAGWWQRRRSRRICRDYDRHLAARDSSLETFSMAEQLTSAELGSYANSSAIIHLHWISYLADYPTFFRGLAPEVPLVWTLHDMNPFTGGCHFHGGCLQFRSGCGRCPQLLNPTADDVSARSHRIKRQAMARFRRMAVVAPSRWMLDLARSSPVWPSSTRFLQIAYGLDLEIFFPVEKSHARRELGLPSDAILIGFGADNLANPRKGFDQLRAAVAACRSRGSLQALVFGGGKPAELGGLKVRAVHHLGYLSNAARQRLAYAACDFFVVPSREDNQPQTVLEALACGTPVIGCAVGGIPEMLSGGENGRLFSLDDVAGLAQAIDTLAESPELRRQLALRGPEAIAEHHCARRQAARYRELYDELLAERR